MSHKKAHACSLCIRGRPYMSVSYKNTENDKKGPLGKDLHFFLQNDKFKTLF